MKMNNITITKPTIDELPQIIDVHYRSLQSTFEGIPPEEVNKSLSKPALNQSWYKHLQDPSSVPLVARNNNSKIIGVACLDIETPADYKILQDPNYPANAPERLRNIHIDPDAKTEGAGIALIKGIHTYAKSKTNGQSKTVQNSVLKAWGKRYLSI